MTKPNPKDFMLMERKGEIITREPGTIKGYDFLIDGCESCEIRLLDRMAQVQVDYCKDTKILLGVVQGSVFVRNCERCTILATCQQLRTRDCVDCDVILLIPGHPIIETSRNIRFGALPTNFYSEMESQMEQAKIVNAKNEWDKIYDFSPEDPPNCVHYSLLTSEQVEHLFQKFPAKPLCSGLETDESHKATAVAEGLKEIRVTRKNGPRFYMNLCKSFLHGGDEKEDITPAIPSNARMALCAAGPAMGAAIQTTFLLEKDGVARVANVTTELVDESGRRFPALRIVLEGIDSR